MSAVTLTPAGYRINGRTYPRVSSILGIINKPSLTTWKLKVGLAEADRIATSAAAFGTLVHAACERVARGEPADRVAADSPDLALPVRAFAAWKAEHVAEVLGVERTVWSEQRRYAGTTDLLVRRNDGRRMVADIKTSRSLSESYALQLSAYQLALEEQGEVYEGRVVLWVPSSHPGVLIEREYTDHDADRRAWRATLALYQWQALCADEWQQGRALLADHARPR